MKIQFDDPVFEAWTQRFLFTMPERGCEIGEIKTTAARIPEGNRDAWYQEWTATADRLSAEAEACWARSARVSARDLYMRASTYYRTSYPLLYGSPTDPRVKAGYAREAEAFARAAALFDPPIAPVQGRDRSSSAPTATTRRSRSCIMATQWQRNGAAITSSSSTGPARAGC